MKKVALVFVLAVLVPSLVLAWLALRSQRDLQFLFERQQTLLCQRVTDELAQNIFNHIARQQQEFGALVEQLIPPTNALAGAARFDATLRQQWPLAEVGFCVTQTGQILAPAATKGGGADRFLRDNGGFLANREAVQLYGGNTYNNQIIINAGNFSGQNVLPQAALNSYADNQAKTAEQSAATVGQTNAETGQQKLNYSAGKSQQRLVNPQYYTGSQQSEPNPAMDNNTSRVVPAEADFRQFIGDQPDGLLARFLQNKLHLMFWHRLSGDPSFIFGAQLDLTRTIAGLRGLVQVAPELREQICLVLLDDRARPVVVSREGFAADWKRPFVATEIGEALPHWEIAAYLVNPAQLTQAARSARVTLGLLIVVLLLAIGVGSWLIGRSLNAELKLARQKTDFVSNVSHELKTPLTSIRMFSELLADGRVTEPAKQKSYLNIISAEAARLTRLINNVLDFSRLESGEKKYNFQPCDLTALVCGTAEMFRPHLEASGFQFDCALPDAAIPVRADSDALAQVIVNLLSNAEKYSNGGKEITLHLGRKESPVPHAEITVSDRGLGVPRGSEEKIFEKFYRAHDSLSSGIQGSGLGLTIARQIARAHGGDVVHEPRAGGGSSFVLRLPISTTDGHG